MTRTRFAVARTVLVLFIILAVPLAAVAQDRGEPPPAPPPAPQPTPPPPPPPPPPPAQTPPPAPAASAAVAQPVTPWFVMAGRPVFAGASGQMRFHWDTIGELLDYKETADFKAGMVGIIPEAFFMPTHDRNFIISASLPFSWGSGKFAEADDPSKVIDGDKLGINYWSLVLGLGYQWYFGEQKRTNLFLMGHLGGGRLRFAVSHDNDDYVSDSLPMMYFDASIGSSYRFDSNFVLGGSLDFAAIGFNGRGGDGPFMDVDVEGRLGMTRLNVLLGYAWY